MEAYSFAYTYKGIKGRSKVKKKYVLDISVLIQSPEAVLRFGENEVILPALTLSELNGLKKEDGEKGEQARSALRFLEQMGMNGSLTEGVPLKNGGILRVEKKLYNIELPEDLPEYKSDNRMLKVCKGLSLDSGEPVILVTENIFLRVAAQIIGIQTEASPAGQGSGRETLHKGQLRLHAPKERLKEGGAPISENSFLRISRKGRR